MRKRYCRRCGTQFGETDKYCIKCGAHLSGKSDNAKDSIGLSYAVSHSNSANGTYLTGNTSSPQENNTRSQNAVDSASLHDSSDDINKIYSSINKSQSKTEVPRNNGDSSKGDSSSTIKRKEVTKRKKYKNIPFRILTFICVLMALCLLVSRRFSSPTRDFCYTHSYEWFSPSDRIRHSKNGFNDNNSELVMGCFTISIPDYWKADTTEEYRYRAYAETSGKVAMLAIASEYDEDDPVSMSALRRDVEDGVMETGLFSGFESYSNIVVHDYHNSSIDGFILSADIQTMGVDGVCEILVVPSVDDNRLFFVIFSQTNNTRYDYSEDFRQLLNSITYEYIPEEVDPSDIDIDNLEYDYAYLRDFLDYQFYYLIDTDAKVICRVATHDSSLVEYGKYRGNIMSEIEVFFQDREYTDIIKFPEGIGKDGIYIIESMDLHIDMKPVPVSDALNYLK